MNIIATVSVLGTAAEALLDSNSCRRYFLEGVAASPRWYTPKNIPGLLPYLSAVVAADTALANQHRHGYTWHLNIVPGS